LIKTKDGRRLLTHEKNLPSLIEFAKTFKVEIYLVEPEENQTILELKPLTSAICSSDNSDPPKYRKIERVFPKSKRTRKTILADAQKIDRYIQKRLTTGKPVSLKELKKKYKEHKLTDACLCNHLTVVRKLLSAQGHTFRKIAAGTYCLSN
jgi:hypothetical protein